MLDNLPPRNNNYSPINDGKVHTYYQSVYNGDIDPSKNQFQVHNNVDLDNSCKEKIDFINNTYPTQEVKKEQSH